MVVKYDVKSFLDLVHLKFRLQRVDEELCKGQKEMYRERASQKRFCKTAEELELFEASAGGYRDRLEQIKLQKKDKLKNLKAVERCFERDGSTLDTELEYRIPMGDAVGLVEIEKDKVPRNPYQQTEGLVVSQVISEDITDEIVTDAGNREVADINELCDNIVEIDTDEESEHDLRKGDIPKYEEAKLLSNKADYMRVSVTEKVCCYPFDANGTESAFEMVWAYFEKIDMNTSFHSVYEEARILSDYYEKQKAEEFIQEKVKHVIGAMELLEIDAGRLTKYSADVLFEVFSFEDMEYSAGIKLFNRVIDRLEINMEQQKRYEVFDRIYTESVQKMKDERDRHSR